MSLERLYDIQPGAEATVVVFDPKSGTNRRIIVTKPMAPTIESFTPDASPRSFDTERPNPQDAFIPQNQTKEHSNHDRHRAPRIITTPVKYMAGMALALTLAHSAGEFAGHAASEGFPENPIEALSYLFPNEGIGSGLNIFEGDK